jgi:RNA polymerase sigma-70 factor (ECF subfamily)
MDAPANINPEDWVELYGDNLFRYAQHRVKETAIAEELVQETFLAAIQYQNRFKGHSSEKTWLFSILKHKIIDYYRFKKKELLNRNIEERTQKQNIEDSFNAKGAWHAKPQAWSSDPEKAYEFRQFLDLFYKCLSKIPQRIADVFVYREIDGLTTQEICNILNISTTNCGVMLYRARMQLRRCLESNV